MAKTCRVLKFQHSVGAGAHTFPLISLKAPINYIPKTFVSASGEHLQSTLRSKRVDGEGGGGGVGVRPVGKF